MVVYGLGGGVHDPPPPSPPLRGRYAVYDVVSGFFAYYESEQEALLDMKPRGAARVVSAVLRPTAARPHMFSFFSDDGKDYQLYVDTAEKLQMWMSALPINSSGNTDKIMMTLRGELDSLRRQLKLDGVSDDVLKMTTLTPEQVANTSGPTLNRAARASNVDAMRLKRELEKLRAENRRLRLEGAGELQADDENELLMAYLSALRSILVMRRNGQFVESVFDTYNECLAQLPDSLVAEMYKNFMLIYLEEADDETLERMTLKPEDVDMAVLGFAEMMTIKLGEMMDQPRHVRIQAIQKEKQRKADLEKSRLEQQERDRANYAKIAAMKEEVAATFARSMPAIEALQRGEGDESEIRRYGRKLELQLLLKSPEEFKQLSKFQWQSMSTSGLRRDEICCLVHVLSNKKDVRGHGPRSPARPLPPTLLLDATPTTYAQPCDLPPSPSLLPRALTEP